MLRACLLLPASTTAYLLLHSCLSAWRWRAYSLLRLQLLLVKITTGLVHQLRSSYYIGRCVCLT